MDKQEIERGYLNAVHAAKYLDVSRNSVYRLAHDGHLEFVRLGKRMLFEKSGVLAKADEKGKEQ